MCEAPPREKRVLSGSRTFSGHSRSLPIRERLIFRLATIEGMRPGEILGLQLRDFGAESLRVSRRVYRGNVDSPKTGRCARSGLEPGTRSTAVGVGSLLPISDRKRGCSSRRTSTVR